MTLVAGVITTTATFLVAQAVFSAYGLDSASLTDADALRTVLSDATLTPILPVVALALGIATRSTAGALTSVLGLIFVPGIVGAVLPQWWQDHVFVYQPGAASEAITSGHLAGSTATMAPGVAALVLLAWLAVVLGGAWAALERRDA